MALFQTNNQTSFTSTTTTTSLSFISTTTEYTVIYTRLYNMLVSPTNILIAILPLLSLTNAAHNPPHLRHRRVAAAHEAATRDITPVNAQLAPRDDTAHAKAKRAIAGAVQKRGPKQQCRARNASAPQSSSAVTSSTASPSATSAAASSSASQSSTWVDDSTSIPNHEAWAKASPNIKNCS